MGVKLSIMPLSKRNTIWKGFVDRADMLLRFSIEQFTSWMLSWIDFMVWPGPCHQSLFNKVIWLLILPQIHSLQLTQHTPVFSSLQLIFYDVFTLFSMPQPLLHSTQLLVLQSAQIIVWDLSKRTGLKCVVAISDRTLICWPASAGISVNLFLAFLFFLLAQNPSLPCTRSLTNPYGVNVPLRYCPLMVNICNMHD